MAILPIEASSLVTQVAIYLTQITASLAFVAENKSPLTLITLQWHFSPGAFSREFSPKRHDGEQRADDPLFPRGLFPGIFLGTANTSCPSRADVTR